MPQPPSARRFAVWAALLLVPLVLAALAAPWLTRRLGPGGGGEAVARASAAASTAEGAAAATARRADQALGEGGAVGVSGPSGGGAARRPEGPTPAQIEASRAADEAVARAQEGWQHVQTMAPREARRDASGDLVAPFHGFGLSVETTPSGAGVRVAGRDMGETPLVTTVDCRPGDAVEVRVERRAYRPQVRTVRCRADALLTVRFQLSK